LFADKRVRIFLRELPVRCSQPWWRCSRKGTYLMSSDNRNVLKAIVLASTLLAPASAALAQEKSVVYKSGKLTGLNDHKVTGKVTILKTDKGYVAVLSDDFLLDSAPDPQLAFGKATGTRKHGYDRSTRFAKLEKLRGKQSFPIPASIDPSKYDEIYVWCPKFYVGLGKATVK